MPSVTFTDYVSTGWGTKYSDVRVDYTENYTISTNTTRVSIDGVYFRVQGDTNWGAQVIKGRVKINGSTVCSFSPGSSTATQINVTGSFTRLSNGSGNFYYDVQHNSDGTGSFTLTLDEAADATVSGIFGFWYSGLGKKIGIETTTSETVTLTTRPRVSSVSATNANFGGTSTISITRYSSDFTHTVTATCAGRTETVATKTSSVSLSWSPTVANFAPLITNAMSATATISCSTYSGSTLIGTTTTTCTMSLTAASVAPRVSISYSDPMGYASTYGKYIKSKSKYAITLSVTLQYGATRSSGSVTANGSTYSYTGSTITTGVITATSNNSISASITDSRGQTATASVTGIQIYDYSPPSITSISANRCDSNGTLNNTGGYYKINLSWSVTSLGSQNTKTLTPADKKVTQSTYANKTAITLASYTGTGTAPATGTYTADINSSYDIKVVLSDAFGSTTAYTSLPTSATRMNWGQGQDGGVAIGKVSEYNKTLEVADDWTTRTGFIRASNWVRVYDPAFDSTASEDYWGSGFGFVDKNNYWTGQFRNRQNTNGVTELRIRAIKKVNGSDKSNDLVLSVSANGDRIVDFSDAAPWRYALGLGNTTGAVPVANGGTGGTTANAALANLGGTKFVKLWTNSSPGSAFAAQTVAVGGSYNAVLVVAQTSSSSGKYVSCVVMKGMTHYLEGFWSYKYGREVSLSTSGVTFGGGYGGPIDEDMSANNIYIVPKYIYGITGFAAP